MLLKHVHCATKKKAPLLSSYKVYLHYFCILSRMQMLHFSRNIIVIADLFFEIGILIA